MCDATQRLMKDLRKIKADPPPGIAAAPSEGNIFLWECLITGVDDTLWEDAVLKLTLEFPKDYPRKPPFARFTTNVFHPNVFLSGEICIDILRKNWSPAYDVSGILLSIQSLLTDPNPAANANPEACLLYINSKTEYENRVRECVEASWK
jgi:ubiquitin-conjugating enzyme E2 A